MQWAAIYSCTHITTRQQLVDVFAGRGLDVGALHLDNLGGRHHAVGDDRVVYVAVGGAKV